LDDFASPAGCATPSASITSKSLSGKDAAHHRAIAAQMDLHREHFAENLLKRSFGALPE